MGQNTIYNYKATIGNKVIPDIIDVSFSNGGIKYDTTGNINGTVNRTENIEMNFSKITIKAKNTPAVKSIITSLARSANNGNYSARVFNNNDDVVNFNTVGIDNFPDITWGKEDITIELTGNPIN